MRKRALALLLGALVLLSGCASPFERSFTSVKTHQEQSASDEDASILRADNYSSLVSCVQYFVSMGRATGTVHIYQYTGDLESDLETACQEVLTEDPLGAYALSGIQHQSSRIISYYECTFTFSYRRSREDLASITSAIGSMSIRRQIAVTMSTFSPTLVLKTTEYYADDALLRRLMREAYYDAPATAMGYPEVSISVYPDSGYMRIIELNFTYSSSQTSLLARAQQSASAAGQLTGQLSAADATSAWLLYSRLADRTEYLPDGGASVYDALCTNAADSEGIALAYQLLCDQVGIPCQMIEGTLDGVPHCWNLVQLEGSWWHTDVTQQNGEGSFLSTDAALSSRYIWSTEDYPACTGDPAVLDLPAATDAEP